MFQISLRGFPSKSTRSIVITVPPLQIPTVFPFPSHCGLSCFSLQFSPSVQITDPCCICCFLPLNLQRFYRKDCSQKQDFEGGSVNSYVFPASAQKYCFSVRDLLWAGPTPNRFLNLGIIKVNSTSFPQYCYSCDSLKHHIA